MIVGLKIGNKFEEQRDMDILERGKGRKRCFS